MGATSSGSFWASGDLQCLGMGELPADKVDLGVGLKRLPTGVYCSVLEGKFTFDGTAANSPGLDALLQNRQAVDVWWGMIQDISKTPKGWDWSLNTERLLSVVHHFRPALARKELLLWLCRYEEVLTFGSRWYKWLEVGDMRLAGDYQPAEE